MFNRSALSRLMYNESIAYVDGGSVNFIGAASLSLVPNYKTLTGAAMTGAASTSFNGMHVTPPYFDVTGAAAMVAQSVRGRTGGINVIGSASVVPGGTGAVRQGASVVDCEAAVSGSALVYSWDTYIPPGNPNWTGDNAAPETWTEISSPTTNWKKVNP